MQKQEQDGTKKGSVTSGVNKGEEDDDDDPVERNRRQTVFRNLGPPDPIDYLRSVPLYSRVGDGASSGANEYGGGTGGGSTSFVDDLRRYDSDEEGVGPAALLKKSSAGGRRSAGDEESGGGGGGGVATVTATTATAFGGERQTSSSSPSQRQDPPARERPVDGAAWPYRDTLSFTRSLVFYGAGSITEESELACSHIQECRSLRQKYFGGKGCAVTDDDHGRLLSETHDVSFAIGESGVAELYHSSQPGRNLVQVPDIGEFGRDYARLVELVSEGAMRSFCFQRLQLLSTCTSLLFRGGGGRNCIIYLFVVGLNKVLPAFFLFFY